MHYTAIDAAIFMQNTAIDAAMAVVFDNTLNASILSLCYVDISLALKTPGVTSSRFLQQRKQPKNANPAFP